MQQLTDEMMFRLCVNRMSKDPMFISRVSANYDGSWFQDIRFDAITKRVVKWYKEHSSVPSSDVLKSIIDKENEKKENKEDSNSLSRLYNEGLKFNNSSFKPSEEAEMIRVFIHDSLSRNATYDYATKLDSKSDDRWSLDKFERAQTIAKSLFDYGEGGSTMSATNMAYLDKFSSWISNPSSRIPTGFKGLDEKLGGGLSTEGKSLYVLMAQTGLGKSNMMANIAVNMMACNLKVLVLSLEMGEDVYYKRIYSIMSGLCIDTLKDNLGELRSRVGDFYTAHSESRITVKEFLDGHLTSSAIEEFARGIDFRPDAIFVDYLNLVKPNSERKNSNMYEDGKIVSEELRSASSELGIPIVTAVQCNSDGMNSNDISLKNISQSRGIAHTADFIGILYKTKDEREREKDEGKGTYENLSFKVEKSRFGRVGDEICLVYDNTTMKIVESVSDSIGISKSDLDNGKTAKSSKSDKHRSQSEIPDYLDDFLK